MHRWWFFCSLIPLILISASAPGADRDLTLVKNGRAAAIIVVPDKGTAAGQAMVAAQALAEYLQVMSGAKLEIRREEQMKNMAGAEAAFTRIYVGESDLARQDGFNTEGLGSGGILVQTGNNALALMGPVLDSDPRANLYAVVRFLEDLGCRYLWPGETGRVIPKRSTITVAPVKRRYTPRIGQRNLRWMGMSDRPENGLKRLGLDRSSYDAAYAKATESLSGVTWLNWQKGGGNLGLIGGHAGAGLRGGWKEWGATHPEWFALQPDGSRDQSKAGNRWRLCISNPALIEHVANDIIQRFNEDPKLRCVSLSPNDGGTASFCLCEQCKKLDPPDAPRVKTVIFMNNDPGKATEVEVPEMTDRYVHYWNAVAARVTKVHPGALMLVDAYSTYSMAPVREKVHPNLVVRYVPAGLQGWDQWHRAGAQRMYWRPNILLLGKRDGMLVAIQNDLGRIMNHMADNGILATDFDSIAHNWSTQGLNYYVAARLSWDPALSAEAILEDYARSGFGPAASPIRKYWQRAAAMRHFVPSEDVTRLVEKQDFSPENLAELRGYLNAADQAADGDEVIKARIAFLRLGLNYTDLHAALDRMEAEAENKSPSELAGVRTRAKPLLDLHFLVLRDFVKNHNMAINAPFLVWACNDFSGWDAIGGKAYRPSQQVLALGDNHSQSGRENSIEEMMAAFTLDKTAVVAAPTSTSPAHQDESDTRIDADETGRPVQVLK